MVLEEALLVACTAFACTNLAESNYKAAAVFFDEAGQATELTF